MLAPARKSLITTCIIVFLCAACSPRTRVQTVTQVVPVTQIVQVTQIIRVTEVVPTVEVFQSAETVGPSPTATIGPSQAPTQGPASVRFTVSAGQDWQNAKIAVTRGQSVSIAYVSGFWSFNIRGGTLYDVGPDGYQKEYFSSLQGKCWPLPAPAAPYGALVARIDYGPAFLVGSGSTFSPDRSGSLWFRINDDCMGDDSGEIVIQVDSGR